MAPRSKNGSQVTATDDTGDSPPRTRKRRVARTTAANDAADDAADSPSRGKKRRAARTIATDDAGNLPSHGEKRRTSRTTVPVPLAIREYTGGKSKRKNDRHDYHGVEGGDLTFAQLWELADIKATELDIEEMVQVLSQKQNAYWRKHGNCRS